MEQVGERLKRERLRRVWTVEYMAAIGGVTAQTQRRYESGKRTPDADYLVTLASGCGLDVQYILTGVRSANVPTQRNMIDAQLREQRGEYEEPEPDGPQSAEPSIVDDLERSNMRVVPELLTAAMEATELVPSSQRPDVLMKVYTLAYAGVPDQAAMSRITASDLAPLVDFVRKYEKPRPKSGPPKTGRLAQGRLVKDEEMPPRTPLSQQKKRKG